MALDPSVFVSVFVSAPGAFSSSRVVVGERRLDVLTRKELSSDGWMFDENTGPVRGVRERFSVSRVHALPAARR